MNESVLTFIGVAAAAVLVIAIILSCLTNLAVTVGNALTLVH